MGNKNNPYTQLDRIIRVILYFANPANPPLTFNEFHMHFWSLTMEDIRILDSYIVVCNDGFIRIR